MPSFLIHIAIANEYRKKHKAEIKNQEEFMKGTLAPDLSKNKYKSHYGNYAEKQEGLSNFIKQTEIDIHSDYGKGYFLHLIADKLFYHHTFDKEHSYIVKTNTSFYHDWDCLNAPIIEEYHIKEIPEEAKKYAANRLDEEPQFLDFKRVKKFIDTLSSIALEEQIQEITNKGDPKI